MTDTRDRAARNRALRQEALRDQIKADQLIRQTLVRVEKLEKAEDLDAVKVAAIKAANDASLRLLAKVLPDLKAVELSQDPENPVFKDERALDSEFARLVKAVSEAEGRVATPASGKGPVH